MEELWAVSFSKRARLCAYGILSRLEICRSWYPLCARCVLRCVALLQDGETAASLAAQLGNLAILRCLLQAGAKQTLVDTV